MKVLFIGDIVGNVGRKALKENLPYLKTKYKPHVVIVNGENAAAGRGITGLLPTNFSTGVCTGLRLATILGTIRTF